MDKSKVLKIVEQVLRMYDIAEDEREYKEIIESIDKRLVEG